LRASSRKSAEFTEESGEPNAKGSKIVLHQPEKRSIQKYGAPVGLRRRSFHHAVSD
jgi:hypothetical protein